MPIRNSPREESTSSTIKSEWLFTRLPEWVVDSLTSRQKVAIDAEARPGITPGVLVVNRSFEPKVSETWRRDNSEPTAASRSTASS